MSDWKEELKQVGKDIEIIIGVMKKEGKFDEEKNEYSLTFGELLKIRGVPYDCFSRLKTGKRKGIFDYKGEFLMSPLHNGVTITLKTPDWENKE